MVDPVRRILGDLGKEVNEIDLDNPREGLEPWVYDVIERQTKKTRMKNG